MKKDRKVTILTSLLFLMLGIILFQNPGGVVKFITYIFGGIFLFIGMIYFIQYWKREDKTTLSSELYSGIISVIIGIIVMFCAGAIEFALRLITGVWILYRAFMSLHYALWLRDLKDPSWKIHALISFILLVIALYVILKSNLILSSIGLVLILYSVVEFINVIYDMIPKKNIVMK